MRGRAGPAGTAPLPSRRRIVSLQKRLLDWYEHNGRDLPWRHSTDPYAVLVSEVMLQQTQVARVVPRYLAFLTRFPTLDALAQADLADVLRLWLGLGYNTRAVRLQACARVAGPALPRRLDELERLPGVGPYTARAVLVFAHDDDLAAVDANVRRVLTHELCLPPSLSASALARVAAAVLPQGRARDWHNALMDYGSLVLTARATGISPRRRQAPFAGSRRQQRARLVRTVVEGGPAAPADLAREVGLAAGDAFSLIDDLAADGLLEVRGGLVRTARGTRIPSPRRRQDDGGPARPSPRQGEA